MKGAITVSESSADDLRAQCNRWWVNNVPCCPTTQASLAKGEKQKFKMGAGKMKIGGRP